VKQRLSNAVTGQLLAQVGIPTKPIGIPSRLRSLFRSGSDQWSERSDPGGWNFQKVIGLVKLVVVEAVGKWEWRSISKGAPDFSTAFGPRIVVHFSPFSPRRARIDSLGISIL